MPDFINKPNKKSKRFRRNSKSLVPINLNRLIIVCGSLCLGLFALIGRMAWLQIFQSSNLEARARASQIQKKKPLGIRRSIVDRNGKLIAIDEKRFRLWAHPKYFHFPGDETGFVRRRDEVVQKLFEKISLSRNDFLSLLKNRDSGVLVEEDIDIEVAMEIKKLGISGIDLEPYPQRFYPQGTLFANVVGFLNKDRIPQAGLEQSLNSQLLRQESIRIIRRGADGTPLPDDLSKGVFYGDDLKLELTLDARLQELSTKVLAKHVRQWNAKKGVAIVMDVSNGEILTLASTPTYNPNSYWKFSPALFREWSVQDLIEPGSTFKPINLALALQEGVIQHNGKVQDNGKLKVGGWVIYNHDKKRNGLIDFPKVLQVSSNVGMVSTMNRLKPAKYWEWLNLLGLDKRPKTDLPGAVAGHLKNKQNFISQPIEQATASYGQGFSLTPLKLAQLHALIANGGYLVSPHITRGLRSGGTLFPFSVKKGKKLLRTDVTETVVSWMESVVEKGSGIGVRTPGYRIGGKTGTAQKAFNGAYQNDAKICSFVASLPTDEPRYVVLVVIDEPQGKYAYGSSVAVPIAKQIIDGLLVLEKIPPTTSETKLKPAEG